MASLKELRNRITSISSTMQITSAMKMVSAAKLKRAQDAIQQLRPYANKLREILVNISGSIEGEAGGYTEVREVKTVLMVVITSNRGLCGAFNANIIKLASKAIAKHEAKGHEVKIFAVGKKAFDGFKRRKMEIVANRSEIFSDISFENSAAIANEIMEGFTAGQYDQVEIFYNRFRNAGVQYPTQEAYLPVQVEEQEAMAQTKDYLFEPSKVEILEDLIPNTLRTQFFKAILDSNASEHGARMTAMHKATDNASELQKSLRLDYNKARQASITNEILEIVGGAEALGG
jgi:F-type H+-transporting ATPase subunit gamma